MIEIQSNENYLKLVSELDHYPTPAEDEIIASWSSGNNCTVSICMLTYNHANYLRAALNGILLQKTDFGFEILIHDDASSDSTQEIIDEYQKRYPRIIKPIFQIENQYSQGINPTNIYNYPRANAEFVAICEGDDCWIDCSKLSRQITALNKNPDIDLAFHRAMVINYNPDSEPDQIIGNYGQIESTIPFLEVFHRKHGMIPTASCVIRQTAKSALFEFINARPYLTIGDLYLQFFGALRGGAIFFPQVMSAYRYSTTHSWTRSVWRNEEKRIEHEIAMLRSYVELNQLTNAVHVDEFRKLIIRRLLSFFHPILQISETTDGKAYPLQHIYNNLIRKIRAKAEEINQSNKEFVIFGAGPGCKLILKFINPERIACIFDRDGKACSHDFSPIPVKGIEEMNFYSHSQLIASTLMQPEQEVESIVKDHGFNENQILYFFRELIESLEIDSLPTNNQTQ